MTLCRREWQNYAHRCVLSATFFETSVGKSSFLASRDSEIYLEKKSLQGQLTFLKHLLGREEEDEEKEEETYTVNSPLSRNLGNTVHGP